MLKLKIKKHYKYGSFGMEKISRQRNRVLLRWIKKRPKLSEINIRRQSFNFYNKKKEFYPMNFTL